MIETARSILRTRLRGLIPLLFGLMFCVGLGSAIAAGNSGETIRDAWRLVVRFQDGQFEILQQIPLRKVIPPGLTLPAGADGVSGSWLEVRDVHDGLVYRTHMPSVGVLYTETPDTSGTGILARTEIRVTDQTFTFLIPASKDAAAVVFFGASAAGPKRQTQPTASVELGRIGLR